jgi:ribonuclease J
VLHCLHICVIELPGYTPSERVVGETLDRIMANSQGRVIVTTFSSLISRIQQVIDAAGKYGRRVFIVGRSMNDTVKMALELGYLNAPNGVLGRLEESMPHNKIIFITTGSQVADWHWCGWPWTTARSMQRDTGPPLAHPGMKPSQRTLTTFQTRGALVMYDKLAGHVHSHGSQEELEVPQTWSMPKFLCLFTGIPAFKFTC